MKKAFLQLHIAVLLAGFTGILGELISLNAGLLVWYRLLITAVTLWVLMSVTGKLEKIPVKEALKIGGIGFVSALHWVLFYASIKYGNVSIGLVCLSAVGFFSAILEPLLTRQPIKKEELLLGICSVFGIYLIFHFDARFKLGIILGFISSFFAALFPILLKFSMKRTNMQTVLTWQMTGGLITLSAIMPFYLKVFPVATLLPSLTDFLWLLVLAWFCSVIAFQFSMNALKKLSAFTVSLSYNLEPLYGILMAFVILKENKTLNQGFYLGFTIISLTLVLHAVLLKRNNRKTADAVEA
ncbi:DMT family transporter [Niabella soli]|uniref:Membrane protein n=1 Tax=Niabella soli DSM 19437 TaxID=929713 RepID=W0F0X5_9BACT|nr:DMT family transporter [Niabella soli]AHF15109.1 membrane protein [Niabella soli DSM 19437]